MLKKILIGSVCVSLFQGCLESGVEDSKSKGPSAIFTTYDKTKGGCLQSDSSGQNCNHFKDAESVYITGANAKDGDYFAAVITPGSQNEGYKEGASGNLSDTIAWPTTSDMGKGDQLSNRTINVKDGNITYLGSHKLGTDILGRSLVQLAPFDKTDNPGGVYVVAVCKVDAKGPSDCKYDTFKIGGDAPPPPTDKVAPLLAIINPVQGALMSRIIPFEAVASDDNFDSMACSVANVDLGTSRYGQIESQIDSTQFPDGFLTFSCNAIDTYGNFSSAKATIEIDNTPPVFSIETPSADWFVSGLAPFVGQAYDAHPGSTDCSIDGMPFLSSNTVNLDAVINTLAIIDGDSTIACQSVDLVGNRSEFAMNITIDNMSIKVMPQSLNLNSSSNEHAVTVVVKGPNVSLLTPISSMNLRLKVPGGSDVQVDTEFGSGGSQDSLMIKFDRQNLINSIKSGIASKNINLSEGVTLDLYSGDRKIGSDLIKLLQK